METRPLGKTGLRVPVVGICPPEGPGRDAVLSRAVELGCGLFGSERPVPGALALPSDRREGYAFVRYNLLDQTAANAEIARLRREGTGVIAIHVLAGGALGGRGGEAVRVAELGCLVKPGRTLVQAALQFVLANESVSAALVRVAGAVQLEELLSAPDAPPLTGSDLEQIFEHWSNRFG